MPAPERDPGGAPPDAVERPSPEVLERLAHDGFAIGAARPDAAGVLVIHDVHSARCLEPGAGEIGIFRGFALACFGMRTVRTPSAR